MSGDNADRVVPAGMRPVRLDGGPSLSVVIASCRDRSLLDACLRSILPQADQHSAEVVVARYGESSLRDLELAYPNVRFVPHGRASIPELRAAGMAEAKGDIVALTEDHCVAHPEWLDQMLLAHRGGAEVVGGSMDNAQRSRAIDWAAYFAEYGFFAGGPNDKPAGDRPITGANVTYSRGVLDEVVRWAGMGEWENVAHARLAGQGRTLRFARDATVAQNQNYHFWAFCKDRYDHGVGYARRRLVDEGVRLRFGYAAGTVFLPGILLLRVARLILPTHRLPFIRAFPFTFAFLAAWSLGEAVGYLKGAASPDGTLGSRVRA